MQNRFRNFPFLTWALRKVNFENFRISKNNIILCQKLTRYSTVGRIRVLNLALVLQ
jgi:hypothetical protein